MVHLFKRLLFETAWNRQQKKGAEMGEGRSVKDEVELWVDLHN